MKCPVCSAPIDASDVTSVAKHYLTKHREETTNLMLELLGDTEVLESFQKAEAKHGP